MVGPDIRRDGDSRERLWALYEAHFGRMVRFCQRALPLSRLHDAEDIVQSVFMEALALCQRDSCPVLDDAWLMRRLRSRIQDAYRQRTREQRLLEAIANAERWVSVEDVAIDRARVADLLATIPDPRDRRMLALKLDGHREADIANLMRCRPVGRPIRDGMLRLRRQTACWRNPDQCSADR
jgi:RNA polymerase sigma factor (sigma-70 family)